MPTDSAGGGPSRAKLVLFSVVVTAAAFAAIEGVLALAGVRPAYVREDPLAGFASRIPHFQVEDGRVSVLPSKRDEMNRQEFAARKPSGATRVFCLGGSTTYGHPFFDATSFCGWLRAFLAAAEPGRTTEVINAGAISYASYRVTGVMRELLEFEPDLFVVYTGQNEFLERRTYERILSAPSFATELVALVNRTRVATALRGALRAVRGATAPPPAADSFGLSEEVEVNRWDVVGPEAFTRENTPRKPVADYFASALEGMVDLAHGAGAEILFVVPASNLSDFSPFKSEHRADLTPAERQRCDKLREQGRALARAGAPERALRAFDEALALDARYADLHFERGRALLALGRTAEARAAFESALEEDVVPYRAPALLRETVREVARRRGVPWVDFEALASAGSPGGIPGEGWFVDHVHLTVEANRRLALAILDELVSRDLVRPAPGWGEARIAAVQREVEASVDPAVHAERLRKLAALLDLLGQREQARKQALAGARLADEAGSWYQVGALFLKHGMPERALPALERAVARAPEQAVARAELGAALAALGREEEALAAARTAVALDPELALAHAQLGVLLAKRGELEAAAEQLGEAARREPHSSEAQANAGRVLLQLGRNEEAAAYFAEAVRLRPDDIRARLAWGRALDRAGRPAEAAQQYRQLLLLAPDHAAAKRRLRALEQREGGP